MAAVRALLRDLLEERRLWLRAGTDPRGSVHMLRATDAGAADITQFAQLLHGRSARCSAIRRTERKPTAKPCRPTSTLPDQSAPHLQALSERWRLIHRARSRTRSCGEHAFRVVKQLWGFSKVRYRGLAKNLARAQTMFALANLLYQVRRRLLAVEAK